MGDDMRLKEAFGEPGPATSLAGESYMVGPTDTDGTITFVVAYPDQRKVPLDAPASAVVECGNHEKLFNRQRNVTGPVTAFPVAKQ
jgi:hypothetical protein